MDVLARLSSILLVSLFFLQQCQPRKLSHKRITADEVYGIIHDSVKVNAYVVLDIRSRMDYIRGHLVSAFWLSPDSIESKIEIILTEKRPLIIYDWGEVPERSKICRILSGNGVTDFFVMDGGFTEWTKRGYPAAIQLVRNTNDRLAVNRKEISAAETYDILKSPDPAHVVIDIRSYPAYAEAHIKGALSIPYLPINEFVVHVEEQDFARNRPVIIYGDAYSDLGEKAAEVMLRNDFVQVYLLKGGIEEWAAKNYPMAYGR
jgi:rhodanese-related sulfurtransferase